MRAFAIVAGQVVLMAAWWSVASRRRDLWHVIPAVLAVLGVTAFLLAPDVEVVVLGAAPSHVPSETAVSMADSTYWNRPVWSYSASWNSWSSMSSSCTHSTNSRRS